jgi:hypothetical protein
MKRAILVALYAMAAGCHDGRPVEYGAQLQACVVAAQTVEQADACIAAVKRAWGRLDAGGSDAK